MELEHMKRLAATMQPAMQEARELCAAMDTRIAAQDYHARLLPGLVDDSGLEILWPLAVAGVEVVACAPWLGHGDTHLEKGEVSFLIGLRVWQPIGQDITAASVLVKLSGDGLVHTWRRLRQLLDAFDWVPAPDARCWHRHSELECQRLDLDDAVDLEAMASTLLEVAGQLSKALTGG